MRVGDLPARVGVIDGGLEVVPAGAGDEDGFEQCRISLFTVVRCLRVGQGSMAAIEYEPARLVRPLSFGPEENDRGDN
eukprot:13834480-Heterocapsa_arctica.AAC.1